MELKITDEQFKAHLSEAILATIGDQGAKELIKHAIGDLVAKQVHEDRWGKTTESASKIQQLFARAVDHHAYDMIVAMVEKDPQVKDAVEGLVRRAILDLCTDKHGALIEAFSEAFRKSLRSTY